MAVGMDGSISPSPASRGGEEAAGNGKDGEALGGGDKALPFEFRALEVCLEFACKSLEQEVCVLLPCLHAFYLQCYLHLQFSIQNWMEMQPIPDL